MDLVGVRAFHFLRPADTLWCMFVPVIPASLESAATVLPVTDVDRSIEHYWALGFEVAKITDEYGTAQRGNVALHLSLTPELDPRKGAGCVYVYVDDADRLAQEWADAGVGHTMAPVDTDYGLREGAHVDPDNNLLRFGADIAGRVSPAG